MGERVARTWIAATLEFPYATVKDEENTPDRARLFGRDLAAAIRTYFEKAQLPATR